MDTPSLGELELAVLLSVARLGNAAYGAEVRRDVSERLGRAYSVGAVYTTLQRLEDKRLLRSAMSDPTPVRGGRAKRCFQVTAAGDRAMLRARERAIAAWQGVGVRWRPT